MFGFDGLRNDLRELNGRVMDLECKFVLERCFGPPKWSYIKTKQGGVRRVVVQEVITGNQHVPVGYFRAGDTIYTPWEIRDLFLSPKEEEEFKKLMHLEE